MVCIDLRVLSCGLLFFEGDVPRIRQGTKIGERGWGVGPRERPERGSWLGDLRWDENLKRYPMSPTVILHIESITGV